MAATKLSPKLARTAPPDLGPESIDFLIRERGIRYLSAPEHGGFDRQQAKRLIFQAWRIRRFKVEAI